MKKILLIFIIAYSAASAQSDQKSIELPDFVITGKQSVNIQTAQKKKPELISIISQGFLLPQYSPDDLPLLMSSAPVPVLPSITNNDYFNGSVNIGLGNYTYPTGSLHLSKSFGYYLVAADVWGKNIKEYVSSSGYNTSGVALNNDLFVSTKSGFLPGTQIKLNGDYSRESYNFFASNVPGFERNLEKGSGSFEISNNYIKPVEFNAALAANVLSFNETGLKEKLIKANLSAAVKFNGFKFGGDGYFEKQYLDNNILSAGSFDFYSVEGYAKMNFSEKLILKGGLYYASNSNNNFIAPFVSMNYKFAEGFLFSAEYKPCVENNTLAGLLKKNMYFNPLSTNNIFTKINSDINASLRYEYLNYYSIGLSAGYAAIDNYVYFNEMFQKGFFNAISISGVKKFNAGIDLLFHPAMLGYFYGKIKYNNVDDANSKIIPYEPEFTSELIYGYDFSSGLGFKIKFTFANGIYTDITNRNKLDDYKNLTFGVSYKIFENLSLTADFQNIFNRSNFVLNGYKEKPFDAIVGVEYRW